MLEDVSYRKLNISNVIPSHLHLKRHYFHSELHRKGVGQTQFFFG